MSDDTAKLLDELRVEADYRDADPNEGRTLPDLLRAAAAALTAKDAEIERLREALAAERERCAKIADEEERLLEGLRNERPRNSYHWGFWERARKTASDIAAAIRGGKP